MPGWDGVLSDDDIWKTVLFIKNSNQMKDNSQPQPKLQPWTTPSSRSKVLAVSELLLTADCTE